MNIYKKQLFLLKEGEKFISEDQIHTVYAHEGNMTEIYKDGRFWAWPNWNGKGPTIVNYINHGTNNEAKHLGTSIREAA